MGAAGQLLAGRMEHGGHRVLLMGSLDRAKRGGWTSWAAVHGRWSLACCRRHCWIRWKAVLAWDGWLERRSVVTSCWRWLVVDAKWGWQDRWLKEASGGRLDRGRRRADVCGPAADRGALVLGLMEWGRIRAMGVEDGCWKMGQMVAVSGGFGSHGCRTKMEKMGF
ncbi:hypothetical protein ACLOJK_004327 [Asimina triloba]